MNRKEAEEFLVAFRNGKARSLVHRMMILHYTEAVLEHHPDPATLDPEKIGELTGHLCHSIFTEVESIGHDPYALYPLLLKLSRGQEPRPSIWFREFDEAYEQYKHRRKLKVKFNQLKPFLRKGAYADIGCGGGDLVAYLKKHYRGFTSFTGIDVMDWRSRAIRKEIDFRFFDFSNPVGTLPEKFDFTTCMAVLHHVGKEDRSLIRFLGNIRDSLNVSGRLLVEEDVILPEAEIDTSESYCSQVEQLKQEQPLFGEYTRLSGPDQEAALILIDLLANSLTVGVPEMHFPFGFRSIHRWTNLFKESGFEVEKVQINGFVRGTFNRSSHVLYLLQRV
jgi:SAM-dependent methyltransferase